MTIKELRRKQEEEFDEEFTNSPETYHVGWGVGDKDRFTFLKFIDRVRKETVESVCDKMIGERRKDKDNMRIYPDVCEGYNQRIKEEKEIKKQIIKEI